MRPVVLAVPWIVAAVLGAAALLLRTPQTQTDPARPSAAGHPAPTPPPEDRPPPQLSPELTLAVLDAARAALGTAGLSGGDPTTAGRWPVEVVLGHVDAAGPGYAVATVHGLVIERAEGGWTAPVARSVAVPVTLGPPARVAGAAWPVASDQPSAAEPDARPTPIATDRVQDVLHAAGWSGTEVRSVDAVQPTVLRAVVSGRTPHGDDVAGLGVWLALDDGHLRLLGTSPRATTREQGP